MKSLIKFLAGICCCLLLAFSPKKEQAKGISCTVNGVKTDFTYLANAKLKKNNDREILTMWAYQSENKEGQHIKIVVTSEAGKHIEPGDYNFKNVKDFFTAAPIDISYFKSKGLVYVTDVAYRIKTECTITEMGNGKVKGVFKGSLGGGSTDIVTISEGSFDLDLQ